MTNQMNDLIRRAAGRTTPSSRWTARLADDDLGTDVTPDHDQGQRNGHIRPSPSSSMTDRIRRAAGVSIRPGQRAHLPEIGGY
ncbi:MAG: hypothetical protein M3143_00285 [Actinomycetota bacterium]|nr:hypothetical protein [Actinomycetota bacterium]